MDNDLSVSIRNVTYEGGDDLIDILNDIVMALKYPIAANKISAVYKTELTKLFAELITITNSTTDEILQMAGIDSIDDL